MTSHHIPLRQLGKDGPTVPAMGFGLAGMSFGYGMPPSDEERFRLLDRALEMGNTFWDTADIYGDNEVFLAKWFQRTGKRDQIFLASKFGIVMGATGPKGAGIDSSGEYCKQQCEASLTKLNTDHIDLYYVHRVNHETPIEETMRALAELQAEGKIKHIGLCEVSSTTLRRACKIAHVAAVQVQYSAFTREIENESGTHLLRTCRELGVAVVCFSPLGRGLLTGTFSTKESVSGPGDLRSSYIPWWSEENVEANAKYANQFKVFADKKGCTASQLALAWLLKQGDDIIPIPGTKKVKYLEQNWASLNVELTDEEEAEIRKFLESVQLQGHRGAPQAKATEFVDTKEEA
ncbi:NADP-dependent oxidoreductase domain-containing protein [Exophiala viscosa]|uniref:NADP-dependent oxidoreductase domain-containing protein n=1 Tax=Exophiala viscosa TaxID=2486360 RepID=A0AAN6DRD2_9EURO|nr:NADP-dependent oxidoreductase domain-containing protein [Exophiala viscosa]KAI1623862.1 NADP-dependent oxidoreductase domain-containing protein [Exophiala viscosa]